MEQQFHVGVKAIFLNGKKEILVLKKNPRQGKPGPYWDIPGGRIKSGQGIEETLRREVEEELGVPGLEITGLFDAVISNINPHGDKTGLLLVAYLCKLDLRQIKLDSEHIAYKWASIKEAKGLLAFKFPKSFLDKLDSLALSGD